MYTSILVLLVFRYFSITNITVFTSITRFTSITSITAFIKETKKEINKERKKKKNLKRDFFRNSSRGQKKLRLQNRSLILRESLILGDSFAFRDGPLLPPLSHNPPSPLLHTDTPAAGARYLRNYVIAREGSN